MHNTAIINYCSNDFRFIGRAIEEVFHFCQNIIVPVCDHFFDGEIENFALLSHTFRKHPKVQFLLFSYDAEKLYSPLLSRLPTDEDWQTLWHSTARYLGFLFSDNAKYLLFIDADEIIDGKRFKKWLDKKPLQENAYWFSSYCYGRYANERAVHLQNTALLVKQEVLSPLKVLNAQERFGIFSTLDNPKQMEVFGPDKKPLIHHYSWVRTKEEMYKKSNSWGKKWQKDWSVWIDSLDIDNQKLRTVTPFFNPLSISLPKTRSQNLTFPNVTKITPKMALEREIYALL